MGDQGWPRRSAGGQNGGVTKGRAAGLRARRTGTGLVLSGEVDAGSWGDLLGALRGLVSRPPADRMVVDVSDLSFIDAHGLRLLAETAGTLSPPRHLSVVRASPGMVRMARILELDRRPGLVFEGSGDAA